MSVTQQEALRSLPAVDQLISTPELAPYAKRFPQSLLTKTAQDALAQIRIHYRQSAAPEPLSPAEIAARVVVALETWERLRLQPIINATGVVLHTNLGRAVLSEAAIQRMRDTAATYSNLEYDLASGARGSRHTYVEQLLCRLTGAEAAMVVNNNAAAVWLTLRELAQGKEVVVSRGQLVEIGGSFRVSEIMAESGAILREVGTTNKTHLHDYSRAIDEETSLLLKVHTSNFAFVGFHHEVSREELAALATKHDIPLYEDLGSGMLYDLKRHHIGNEPTVAESVRAGVDIVSFSGDKLLGGPQAGLIVGKRRYIERLKKNQLARAVRIDKLSLAALTSTLETYLQPERAREEIPVLRAILMKKQEVQRETEALAADIRSELAPAVDVSVHPTTAEVGGGSLPGVELPSYSVRLVPHTGKAHHVERALRYAPEPLIGRLFDDALWLDPRTLQAGEREKIAPLLREAMQALR